MPEVVDERRRRHRLEANLIRRKTMEASRGLRCLTKPKMPVGTWLPCLRWNVGDARCGLRAFPPRRFAIEVRMQKRIHSVMVGSPFVFDEVVEERKDQRDP